MGFVNSYLPLRQAKERLIVKKYIKIKIILCMYSWHICANWEYLAKIRYKNITCHSHKLINLGLKFYGTYSVSTKGTIIRFH